MFSQMEKKNKPPQKKHWQKTKKHSGFKEKHFFYVFSHMKKNKKEWDHH